MGRHLQRLGALALPLELLPLGETEAPGRLPWRYSRDIMRGLETVIDDPDLHPLVVVSYGCGPDAFATKHVARRLEGRRYLELELDEHRGEAGLITRLEAFLDEIAASAGRPADRSCRASTLPPPLDNARHRHRGRRVFVANFADHAHAVVGGLRAAGLDAQLLPPPDRALQERAERCSSGKECHPYALLAADLDRLADEHQPGDIYFMPGSTIPCLIQQYGEAMRILLEKRGVRGLDLLSPDMVGYKDLLGYGGALELYKGLLAVDLLVRVSCSLRPYELEPGSCDGAHQLNLREVEEGLAAGRLEEALRRCLLRMSELPVDAGAPPRPRVGVAGDIYTRINHAANRRLFWTLEELGCEVWPAPFLVDIARYGIVERFRDSLRRRQLPLVLRDGLLTLWLQRASQQVERLLAPTGARWDEPDLDTCLALAAPYIGRRTMDLLQWNVGKMVHFARGGAHGVVNAVGQNCMVGTISAAITRRLRSDHHQIPVVTLFYGSSESDTVRASLEAFAHQVKRWAAAHPARAAARRRSMPARSIDASSSLVQ
jgi:predicted nucleotide-binding protein (sugar kinase/HSP70/actin superfamily)